MGLYNPPVVLPFLTVTGGPVLLSRGTITASDPVTLTQTWNAGGVTFNSLLVNVTNTASAVASMLIDLQVAGATRFKVLNTGAVFGLISFNLGSGADGYWGASGFEFPAAASLEWSATSNATAAKDLKLFRDAANALGLRNTTSSQTLSWHDTWASTTDYHRGALKTARATLSNVSGATVTATAIIPDGAVVVGVTTKVTTGLGVGSGTTGYLVGTVADPDRWGAVVGTASGTSSDNTNWTAGTIEAFTAASDILITASGGNFDGTGVIYVSVQYLIGQCD